MKSEASSPRIRLRRTVLAAFLSTATLASAEVRYARFEGMQIATAPKSITLTDRYSLEGWIFVERLAGFVTLFGKMSDPPNASPYHSANVTLKDKGQIAFLVATAATDSLRGITAQTPVPMRTWTHIVATQDGTATKLFINGQLAGSGGAAGTPGGSTPITIGASFLGPYGIVGGFAGVVRGVRVWNRPLSAAEVIAARNGEVGATAQGLVAWWPLEGFGNDLARDAGPANLPLLLGLTSGDDRRDPRTITSTLLSAPRLVLEPQNITPHTGGVAHHHLVNYDNDRAPDIIETPFDLSADRHYVAGPIRAFHNDGRGHFSDASALALPAPRTQVYTSLPDFSCTADFNADGRADLFLGDSGPDESPYPGGQSHLLIQDANAHLVDETDARLPKAIAFTHGVTCGDLDRDGDVDIVDAKNNITGPRIYLNDGRGFFTDGTLLRLPSFITSMERRFISVASADWDRDGDVDLFWGEFDQGSATPDQVRGTRDVLLLNNGSGYFAEAPKSALPLRTDFQAGTLSQTVADFDADGWPDLLLAQMWGYRRSALQLFLNDRRGGFIDATSRISGAPFPDLTNEPGSGGSTARVVAADFNGDGLPDFVTSTHNEYPVRLYLNTGNANFYDASEGLPNIGYGWILPADVDRDGDVDLFVSIGQGRNDLFVARNNDRTPRRRALRR